MCATIPELGSLAEEIGGDHVRVNIFAKGTEDTHYLDAKPSFIRMLRNADLYIQNGMELEAGWAPFLLKNSRNKNVQPGGNGFLDVSRTIVPLEVPHGRIDRSMGDVHPQGNPHYLTDPINGLRAADLLRDRLILLAPANRKYFAERYTTFRNRLGAAMIGKDLARKYDFEKIVQLHQHGRLEAFLQKQGDLQLFGGWLAMLLPHRGTEIMTYHKSWPYFAKRFGFQVAGYIEPKPGIPPSPSHLLHIIQTAKTKGVRIILMEPWLDKKPASLVAGKTGAEVIAATLSGTSPGTPYSYLTAMEGLVNRLAAGLSTLP